MNGAELVSAKPSRTVRTRYRPVGMSGNVTCPAPSLVVCAIVTLRSTLRSSTRTPGMRRPSTTIVTTTRPGPVPGDCDCTDATACEAKAAATRSWATRPLERSDASLVTTNWHNNKANRAGMDTATRQRRVVFAELTLRRQRKSYLDSLLDCRGPDGAAWHPAGAIRGRRRVDGWRAPAGGRHQPAAKPVTVQPLERFVWQIELGCREVFSKMRQRRRARNERSCGARRTTRLL